MFFCDQLEIGDGKVKKAVCQPSAEAYTHALPVSTCTFTSRDKMQAIHSRFDSALKVSRVFLLCFVCGVVSVLN